MHSKRRPRVLQISYCCSPYRGSEPGIGWNFATASAKEFDTWVISEEIDYGEDLRKYENEHGYPSGLHVQFVRERPWAARLWRVGLKYYCYKRWQRRVFALAKKLHSEIGFDLVHQVNIIGFREPGYVWKLDAPFVWGPIGGTQNFPTRFLPVSTLSGGAIEVGRNLANNIQLRANRRVAQAAGQAKALLFANSEGIRDFRRFNTIDLELFSDIMISDVHSPKPAKQHRELRLLWSGGFWTRKALPILLRALGQLPEDIDVQLRVLGDGPLRDAWKRLAEQEGVSAKVEWLGWMPRAETIEHYQWADAFAFTSLRDTTGTVNIEALSHGLPIICFDHQGVGDAVHSDCGIKIPVRTPSHAIDDFRDAIIALAKSPEEVARLSQGAIRRAEDYLWSKRSERLCEIYHEVLQTKSHAGGAADV